MTFAIDSEMTTAGSTTTFTETFVGFAKATLYLAIFGAAMKMLESYYGVADANPISDMDSSDDDVTVQTTYTQIKLEQHHVENCQLDAELEFTEFVKEQVIQATTIDEEKEEKHPFVIGAEDPVDHLNRMIGC